jgi:hypothetical protein
MNAQALWRQEPSKATRAQMQKLCALLKETGINDVIWRHEMLLMFGKTSRTELSVLEAAEFIEYLEREK